MTDSRTTELRISEPLRGFIRHQSNRAYIDGGQARWLTDIADKIDAKHEQAIAATLGSGTLTAEQVREAIERHVKFYEGGDYDEQAIADELNAELGSGTCEVSYEQDGVPRCSKCQNVIYDEYKDGFKNYCDECGAKVRKKVER